MSDSLDPEDWNAFRSRAHQMLDIAIDRMESAKEGPVWQKPDAIQPVLDGQTFGTGEAANDAFLKALMPYAVGNTHPRFFGWVHGAGTPSGLISEMIAAAMNANCGGRNHAAIRVERSVIAWALDVFGLPETGSGLLTTGTSMATVVSMKVARDRALGFDVRKTGVANGPDLVGYTSRGAHSCIDRAFDMLGLGSDALRKITKLPNGQMDTDELAAQIAADKASGKTPFVICATAGTVNRGAIDKLEEIADIAQQNELWFHVDAAFAGALRLSDTYRHRLNGIERADSIAFDFHKWMQVNYDAGCALIRDEEAHRRTFSDRPDYLADMGRGLGSDMPWPVDYGPELSRGFRALKIWSQLIEHGPRKLGQVVERNIEQAGYLARLVNESDCLELLSYQNLNICCFRYIWPGLSESDHDLRNQEIVIRLQESGIAAPSTTRIEGKLAIRVNITNHRTRLSDMEILRDSVLKIAPELSQ